MNKNKVKEERNKIHCKGKGKRVQQTEFLSKVTVNEWKQNIRHNILKKREKILAN